MTLSAPTQSTKAYQRKQQGTHAQLAAFVKEKAGRSEAKRKAAMMRAATMPNRLPKAQRGELSHV